jgi:SAM-dependent methyltransferase
MPQYERLARYHDLAEQRLIDYEADIASLDEAFRGSGARTVLDLACGTGTHLLGLARLGYECAGMDLEPQMIAVAREKAERHQQNIELFAGDMRDYSLGRTFDAAFALYALTSLETKADLRAALASARRAVRDGGWFYFNLLNADAGGATGPASYIDAVVTEPIRLVRLNQVFRRGDVQDWSAVYMIDEGKGLDLIVDNRQLHYHRLEAVQAELSRASFDFRRVVYRGIQGEERSDMHVLAQARSTGRREDGT